MVFGLGTTVFVVVPARLSWCERTRFFRGVAGDKNMSDINVQLKNGEPIPVPDSATVAEALKKLDRDLAKQALAAKIGGREVDLAATLEKLRSNGDASSIVQIEPIVPQTRDGLE